MLPPPSNTLPATLPAPGWRARAACALAGVGCAAAIFGTLALTRSPGEPAPEAEVFVARQLSVPVDEPPPLVEPAPLDTVSLANPIRLEIAASTSPVRIQVPDLPAVPLQVAPPAARPTLAARFDLAKSAAKPVVDNGDMEARRVFDRGDVDQQPIALQRVTPRISYGDAYNLDTPRTTMLVIVNTDGTVGDVRIVQSAQDEYFDRMMVEAIRQWRFSPAVRKGRKVRCWVQQAISVQLNTGSPFSTN
ncbi:MAG TPA: TonB family protein [Opitutaceae bacterium]|nr:TonB family protein [Opitutaceae bacterium]